MTEFNDDQHSNHDQKSFKEQILAELEEANRLKDEREARAKALETKQRLEEQEKARIEAKLLAEAAREEERRQAEQALASQEEQVINQGMEPSRELDSGSKSSEFRTTENVPDIDLKADKTDVATAVPNQETEEIFLVRATDIPTEGENVKLGEISELEPVAKEPIRVEDLSKEEEGIALSAKNKHNKRERRQKADNVAKRIARILISIIILVLLLTAFVGYRFVDSAIKPVDSNSNKFVQVEIPIGSGNKLIGQILEKAGVIKSATVFNYYSKFKNYSNFQSGYYNLKKSMTLDQIAAELEKGGTAEPTKPALGKILITEGYTIKQIAKAIESNKIDTKTTSTPYKADDFLKLVQDETFIKKMVAKYPNLLGSLPDKSKAIYQLEGYLFPATYNYYKDTTLEGLVEDMISTMNTKMAPYYNTIKAKNMSVNDVLTLSSLVEKEGSTDEDRRKIASVFYNRLSAGQALQSNIAILYAMGKLGDKTSLAEDAQINTSIKSPYNIYTNTGLMPGPVDSPSISAIEATIKPASTDYLYFVADVKTGNVYYAKDFETHKANVEKYINSQIN
ncbi:TPA: endolytic transglycosylase MltG [Streptococcus agalactiae]